MVSRPTRAVPLIAGACLDSARASGLEWVVFPCPDGSAVSSRCSCAGPCVSPAPRSPRGRPVVVFGSKIGTATDVRTSGAPTIGRAGSRRWRSTRTSTADRMYSSTTTRAPSSAGKRIATSMGGSISSSRSTASPMSACAHSPMWTMTAAPICSSSSATAGRSIRSGRLRRHRRPCLVSRLGTRARRAGPRRALRHLSHWTIRFAGTSPSMAWARLAALKTAARSRFSEGCRRRESTAALPSHLPHASRRQTTLSRRRPPRDPGRRAVHPRLPSSVSSPIHCS
jgi:hypothetical protein